MVRFSEETLHLDPQRGPVDCLTQFRILDRPLPHSTGHVVYANLCPKTSIPCRRRASQSLVLFHLLLSAGKTTDTGSKSDSRYHSRKRNYRTSSDDKVLEVCTFYRCHGLEARQPRRKCRRSNREKKCLRGPLKCPINYAGCDVSSRFLATTESSVQRKVKAISPHDLFGKVAGNAFLERFVIVIVIELDVAYEKRPRKLNHADTRVSSHQQNGFLVR